MTVGTLLVTAVVRDSGSLKEKRRVLKSLKDRVRDRFNVSVAELGSQDLWQKTELGFAAIGNEARFVDGLLANVLNYLRTTQAIDLVDHSIELF
ncbi:MAG: DUF503 domain-containing protein [Planctomycetota bacterium]|nr:DUF503 domain-containing protein [Planctomycetota bacterium]